MKYNRAECFYRHRPFFSSTATRCFSERSMPRCEAPEMKYSAGSSKAPHLICGDLRHEGLGEGSALSVSYGPAPDRNQLRRHKWGLLQAKKQKKGAILNIRPFGLLENDSPVAVWEALREKDSPFFPWRR